jgi:hypothetical protein
VFISSTFLDLQPERQEVIQALLELDCSPAGMELLPASNDERWDLIKSVIDDSDNYLVIVGGRCGSVEVDSGLSYTEKSLSKPKLAQLPVPVPSVDEPAEIVRRVAAVLAEVDELETRMDAATGRVERSSQALLAKAFRGDLTIATR